ncbi:MAG TPA: hypothetical protein VK196_11110 [Magnetospirillum sp.]|nr:hypothetical protein [Magnetospirillum sp.]
MTSPGILKRFMYQGYIGFRSAAIPFAKHCEVLDIPSFALSIEQPAGFGGARLAGEMRFPFTGFQWYVTFSVLALMVNGALTVAGLPHVIDPLKAKAYGALAVFILAFQLFMKSRRCRISIHDRVVRVEQRHALFSPRTMAVPLAEFPGIALFPWRAKKAPRWSVMLVHPDIAKHVPLSWHVDYSAALGDLARYCAALNKPAVELDRDGPKAMGAADVLVPLAEKTARDGAPPARAGLPPAGLDVEMAGGRTVVAFAKRRRLTVERGSVTLETRGFGGWSVSWRVNLDQVLGVRMVGVRPSLALQTADRVVSAGPFADEVGAAWAKAKIIEMAGFGARSSMPRRVVNDKF